MTGPGPRRHVLYANEITHLPDRHFAVVNLLPGADSNAPGGAQLLVVVDEQEHRLSVQVGETFAVGEETWRLDEVTMPEDRRFSATISRVD